MSLPNVVPPFVPFDPLPAASLNDMEENIEALAAGTGLDDGAVTPSKLATGAATAYVATSATTASGPYTDLTTAGPAVTATIGANGIAQVTVSSHSYHSGANDTLQGFAVSGATTVAADDKYSKVSSATSGSTASSTFLVTGLTAGSNTFTCKYRVGGGTGTWLRRHISVIPL